MVILGEAFFLAKCHTYKADNQGIASLVILGDTLFHTFYEEKTTPVQVSVGRIHEAKRVMSGMESLLPELHLR